MPDWTYHPLLRPVGIAIHGSRTRDITLRHLARIGRFSGGRWLVRCMGHMTPAEVLTLTKADVTLVSPVMLTNSIDPNGVGFDSLSQFEFGAIEVAPEAAVSPRNSVIVVSRYAPQQSVGVDVGWVRCRLDEMGDAALLGRPLLVDVAPDIDPPVGVKAVAVEGERDPVVAAVQRARLALGPDALIAAGGYVNSPAQALELRSAGADVILVGEGLAQAGPGLAKRINEAIVGSMGLDASNQKASWVAGTLFGLGTIFASLVAAYLAMTTVILGYDETFVHLSRVQLEAVNGNLLHFMKHDRLSYAGATMSLGIFYAALAFFGIRKGERWAFHTYVVAGVAGFLTTFLFVLFHYFDVGNILVSLTLLPFFFASIVERPTFVNAKASTDLQNDGVWRRALVGQLLFVMLAVGLIVGGTLICVVGSTHVFVISDLDFLHTTADHLSHSHHQLLPLIAHDRVSFGGAIVCNGLALLMMALWGFKRGDRWMWWTILLAGVTNLGCTLYAHFSTGYTAFGHLLPVFVGAAFFVVGLACSYSYLCRR